MSEANVKKVVVWGDSIAASGWPALAERSHNVSCHVGATVQITNEGVGGKPASHAVKEFEQRVAAHKPDIVIIQFGFNDVRHDGSRGDKPLSTPEEFEQHIATMAQACVKLGAVTILFGNHRTRRPNSLPTGLTYDEARKQYNRITHRVAVRLGLRYVDMSEATLVPDAPWYDLVNEDGVHLSQTGLHAYACVASTVLMETLAGMK